MRYELPKIGEWVATKDQKPETGEEVLGLHIYSDSDPYVATDNRITLCFRELENETAEYQWIETTNGKKIDPPKFWADVSWLDVYDDNEPADEEN